MLVYYICLTCGGFTVAGNELECCSYCHSKNIIELADTKLREELGKSNNEYLLKLQKEKLWYGKMSPEQRNIFVKQLQKDYVKNQPLFDEEKHLKYENKKREYQKLQNEEFRQKAQDRRDRERAEREATRPRCPTCHSTDINPITVTQKAGSFLMFGIFSQKVKRQFHCNNCGYEW